MTGNGRSGRTPSQVVARVTKFDRKVLSGLGAGGGFVDEIDEPSDVVHRRFGEDAVPQVEDVAGAAGGAVEDRLGVAPNYLEVGKEDRRIEVPLDASLGADPFPRLVQRNPPIHADDVAPRLGHPLQKSRGVGAEVDEGDAESGELLEDSA